MRADAGARGTSEVGEGGQGGNTWPDGERHAAWKGRHKRDWRQQRGGRRKTIEDPSARRKDNIEGGKYRAGGRDTEESADESAEWSGEQTEELAL